MMTCSHDRPSVKLPVPGIPQEMIDAGYAAWRRAADFIYPGDEGMTDEIIVMIYQAMEERRLADVIDDGLRTVTEYTVTARADQIIQIDATGSLEPITAALSRFIRDAASRIDAALPSELCDSDPMLAERRRCAYAALSAACPHYMAEGTLNAAVDAILKENDHDE